MLVTDELTGDSDVEGETTGVELLYGVPVEELTGDSEVEEITMLELPYGAWLELLTGVLVTDELTGDSDVEEETTGVELLYGVSVEELTGDSEVEGIAMLELPYGTSLEELLYGVSVEELTGAKELTGASVVELLEEEP